MLKEDYGVEGEECLEAASKTTPMESAAKEQSKSSQARSLERLVTHTATDKNEDRVHEDLDID